VEVQHTNPRKSKPALTISTPTLNKRKFYILASESISVIAEDGRTNSNYFIY